jgi:hypothetical protein
MGRLVGSRRITVNLFRREVGLPIDKMPIRRWPGALRSLKIRCEDNLLTGKTPIPLGSAVDNLTAFVGTTD